MDRLCTAWPQCDRMSINIQSIRELSVQSRCRFTLAVPSSEPLTSSGGPLLSGQQVFTKLSCSAIFFTCSPVSASHARTCAQSTAALAPRDPHKP